MTASDILEIRTQAFADSVLSPADLVGRVFRLSRTNWKAILRNCIVPAFFYSFSYSSLTWLSDHPNIANSVQASIIAASILVLVVSTLEMRIIQFALLQVFFGRSSDFASALQLSRKKVWLILLLVLPSLIIEVAVFLLAMLSFWFMRAGSEKDMASLAAGILIFCLLIISSVPLQCLTLLNLSFITSLVAESLSIKQCFSRFTKLFFQGFRYVLSYYVLFALISFLLEICNAVVTGPDFYKIIPNGALRETLKNVELVLECCVSAPLYAFLVGASAIGCAGVQTRLTMQLECSDLVKRLSTAGPAETEANVS